MSDDTTELRTILHEHPRLMGVLFAICLALSQAGVVAAGNNGATY